MKHVDSLSILGINICTVLDKQSNQAHVAVESTEVQGSEAIITTTMSVKPLLENGLPVVMTTASGNDSLVSRLTTATVKMTSCCSLLLKDEFDKYLTCPFDVLISCIVNWRVSTLVKDIHDVKLIFCRVQVLSQL